jgi:hypothetical protein
MAQNEIDAVAKATAAMFGTLLDKLVEKGVLDKSEVEQVLAAGTKALKGNRSALEEMGERDRNDPRSA